MNSESSKASSVTSSTSSRNVASVNTTTSDLLSSEGILSSSASVSFDDYVNYTERSVTHLVESERAVAGTVARPPLKHSVIISILLSGTICSVVLHNLLIKGRVSPLSMARRAAESPLQNGLLDEVTSSRTAGITKHWEKLRKSSPDDVTSLRTNPVSRGWEKLQRKTSDIVTSSRISTSSTRCERTEKQMPGRRNWKSTFRSNQVSPAPENQPTMAKSSSTDNDCSASSTSTASSSSLKTPSPFVIHPRGRDRYRVRRESSDTDKTKKEEEDEEPSVVDKLQHSLDQLDRFVNVSLKEEVFLARGDLMPRHYERNKKLAKRYETLKQVMVFQELLVRIRQAREEKNQNNPQPGKPLDPIGEEPEEQKGSQTRKNDRLSPDGESSPDNECDSESAKTKGKSPVSTNSSSKSKIKTSVPRKPVETTDKNIPCKTSTDSKRVTQANNVTPSKTECGVQNNRTQMVKDNSVSDSNDHTTDAFFRGNVDKATYEQLQHHKESSLIEGVTKETDSGNEDDFKVGTGSSSRTDTQTPVSHSGRLTSNERSKSEESSKSFKQLSSDTSMSLEITKRPELKKQRQFQGRDCDSKPVSRNQGLTRCKSPVKNKPSITEKEKSVCNSLQSDVHSRDSSRCRSRTTKQNSSTIKARTPEEVKRTQTVLNDKKSDASNFKSKVVSRRNTDDVLNSKNKVSSDMNSRNKVMSRRATEDVLYSRNTVPNDVSKSKNNVVKSSKGLGDAMIFRNTERSRTSSPAKALTSSNTSVTDSGITSNGGCGRSTSDVEDIADSGDSDDDVHDETSNSEDSNNEIFSQSHTNTTTSKQQVKPGIKQAVTHHIPLPEHRYRHESEKMERPCSPVTDHEHDVFVPIKLKWSNQSSLDELGACGGSPTYDQNPYLASANDIRKGLKVARSMKGSGQSKDRRVSTERKKVGQTSKKKNEKSPSLKRKVLKVMSNPKVIKPSGELVKRGKTAEDTYAKFSKKKEKNVKKTKETADSTKKKKVKTAKK